MGRFNLILANRWSFPVDNGGVTMHNINLVYALHHKFKLMMLSLNNYDNNEFHQNINVPFFGVNIKNLPFSYLLGKNQFVGNTMRSYNDYIISKEMAKVLDQISFDIVEFMDIHSESYVFLKRRARSRIKSKKVVIRAHTPWGLLRTTYLPKEIQGVDGYYAYDREYFCFHHCDAITTPSQDLKNRLMELYHLPDSKITVIHNLLDTDHFKPIDTINKANSFTFLHVGRFERAKGVVTMVKAFVELARMYPEIRLINVGEPRGSAYEQCHKLLTEAKLIDRVTFTGYVPYETLPEYYAIADTVIVPSEIYESFSFTAAQAMACGKWLIISDTGGMPETIVKGKYGAIFPKGDVHDLVLKMNESLFKTYQCSDCIDYSRISFGIKSLGERYLSFYSGLHS